jgi:tRNA threonylcarbamoyladenosine biosynthesis protein TsaB
MQDGGNSMSDSGNSWLFLDASGVTTRVGVWQDARWLAWRQSEAPALEALFAHTHAALNEAGLPWEKLGGYIYVEGPGSVLGLRLAAMAVRAWQTDDAAHGAARPVRACGSLPLAAALALAIGEKPPFTVFTDAKQGFWQILAVDFADVEIVAASAPREIAEAELPSGPLLHLPARKAWHRAPPHARALTASLENYPGILAHPALLRPVKTATPYAGRPPEYKKWAGAK